MSDFWKKKLNEMEHSEPVPTFDPNLLPRGVGANRDQTVRDYMARAGYPIPDAPVEDDTPPGSIHSGDAIRSWKGNALTGAVAENLRCPKCGSGRYVTPSNSGVTTNNGTVYPKPHCFECGYPSEQGTLGVGAKTQGPVGQSRQGSMPPLQLTPQMKAG